METPAGNRDGKEEMLNIRLRAEQNNRLQRGRGKPKELPKSAGMERKWRNGKALGAPGVSTVDICR